MPGPAKTPSALAALMGNPGRRPISETEPRPEVCIPEPACALTAEQRHFYDQIGNTLFKMRVLTEADWAAIALLAVDFALWVELQRDVLDNGRYYTVVGDAGGEYERPRPVVADLDQTTKRVKAMLQEFGLTPASRSKVSIAGTDTAANELVNKYLAANK